MISREPNITEWEDLSGWDILSEKVGKLSSDLIKRVPSFQRLYGLLSDNPTERQALNILSSEPFAANVFVYILRNNTDYYAKYMESTEIIDLLGRQLKDAPSYTQRLFKLSYLENLHQSIETSPRIVERIIVKLTDDELISVDFLRRSGLLTSTPIESFVEYCFDVAANPKKIIQENKVEISYSSQTFREIESLYILRKIDLVNLKEKTSLPQKLLTGGFFEVPYKNSELLGHEILRRILRKISSVDIHHVWVDLILDIASDPRSSKQSDKYIKWWDKIDQSLIDEFIKVLSHNDILLFLDAIQDFAEESNNSAMKRMYESRKTLLKGLAIQGLIDESRLILPSSARRFIRRQRKGLDQSFIVDLNARQGLCAIYLKVGDLCIVEGSHNFSMRLFYDLREVINLMNPSLRHLQHGTLTNLDYRYERETGRESISFMHDPRGRWKRKVIKLIKQEVELDVRPLLTEMEAFRISAY